MLFRIQDVVILCVSVGIVTSASLLSTKFKQIPSEKALNFMKRYGYIIEDGGNSEALYSENGITEIIKTVQKFGALKQTGIIDNATLKLMSSPRCGVPDIIRSKRSRMKRFVLGSSGWNKRNITFFIANWSPSLGEHTVAKYIQKALDTWARYGRLTFTRVFSPDADIVVAFGRGYHGDTYPFDGPGNVLAHAFFPYEDAGSSLGGDLHFDDEEKWADRDDGSPEDGTDFYTVALHELGHSLGLAHSPIPNSIMFPYYKGFDPDVDFQLDHDDILGMYNLYIRRRLKDDDVASRDDEYYDRTSSTYRPTTKRTTTYENDYTTSTASYPRYPQHTTTENGYPYTETPKVNTRYPWTTSERTYTTEFSTKGYGQSTVTYDGDYETVDDHKKHDRTHNIPENNSPSFPNICDGHLDAVATLRGEIFVFKDQYIWRFRDKNRLVPGYPVLIQRMFPQLPETIKKIDAAYQRPDGTIALFVGNQVWLYDGREFIENSPRRLDYFGLPNYLDSIDAVQNWARNGKTYFYKNDRFWRYNEKTRTMDAGYPRHMGRWRGVPEYLDAATTFNGTTYFFKGGLFWRFDNDWIITTDHSPFPTAEVWLGCPEEEHRMARLFS